MRWSGALFGACAGHACGRPCGTAGSGGLARSQRCARSALDAWGRFPSSSLGQLVEGGLLISDSSQPTRGPWRIRSIESVYGNPWIEVLHHEVVQPDGRPGLYGVVHFKHTAVAILPIDAEGHTWLVGQHRFPPDAYSWELPEGGGALDDDPVLAARRELKEETGLEAQSFRPILTMHLSNSVSDERSVSYLATGLTQGSAEPEGTEVLRIMRLPFAEVFEMALDGRITDALSIATILRAQLLFQREPELLGKPKTGAL